MALSKEAKFASAMSTKMPKQIIYKLSETEELESGVSYDHVLVYSAQASPGVYVIRILPCRSNGRILDYNDLDGSAAPTEDPSHGAALYHFGYTMILPFPQAA